ncbi:MAG: TonB family protein [Syntrophales bacterium]|nr:TonB family protein [Syntrophales bacterium]
MPKAIPPEKKKPERVVRIRPEPVEKPPEIKPVQEKTPETPRIEEPALVEPKLEEIVVHRPEPVESFVAAGPEILQMSEEQAPLEMSFGSSEGPQFLKRVLPLYPRRAKKLHKSGTVILMLTIDEKGVLGCLEVVKGAGYGFDEESVRAMKQSTFISARRNGKPVTCRAVLPVRFELR